LYSSCCNLRSAVAVPVPRAIFKYAPDTTVFVLVPESYL
jgi:hypothetical protein